MKLENSIIFQAQHSISSPISERSVLVCNALFLYPHPPHSSWGSQLSMTFQNCLCLFLLEDFPDSPNLG